MSFYINRIIPLRFYSVLVFLICSLSYSPKVNAQWFKDTQAIMGTEVRVEFWLDDTSPGSGSALLKMVMLEMHRIDQLMSPYKKNSELSKINQNAASSKVVISNELFNLIKKSIEISKLTNGAFDVTFASVGNLYDYRNKKKPAAQLISANLPKISYKHLILTQADNSVKFARSGVIIDLGGIAKGLAVDNSIKILSEHGIQHGLVSAGGDTRIIGDHRGRPWVTGIRNPRVKGKSAVLIPLSNTAISTSGDYERYFIEDGIRYHHIISPKTGRSISSVQSVSVIGPDSTTCDALSTSLFVLGTKAALKLIEQIANFDAIIIDANGKLHYSSGLLKPHN